MYEYNARVGFSQCDTNKKLTITALIDIFQDCSTFQSEDLNVGFDALDAKDLVWVINYWEIYIDKQPILCDRVKIGTMPYDFKGCFGYRNFYMKNDKDEYIIKANSLWTLINKIEQKPEKAPEFIRNAYILEEKLDMPYGSRKVAIPDESEAKVTKREPIIIQLHHLDSNHHVNNGQYVKLAMSSIGEDVEVSSIRVDYRKQAVLGSVIYPVVYEQDGAYVIALYAEDGKAFSVMEVR